MRKYFILLSLLCTINFAFAQNEYIDSLKQQLQFAKEDTNKVNLLSELGWVYVWSYADTSVMYVQEGLQLSKSLQYTKGEGLCMYQLSLGLTETGNFITALDYGFKAIKIFEALHDTPFIALANLAVEIAYRDEGDYEQALVYGYKSLNGNFEKSVELGNISSVYEKNNQLDSALYYGNKTYELNKDWSGITQTLGNIHAKLGHTPLALDYYKKGIIIATQQHTYRDLIDIYNGMSKLFESVGNTDSAIYYANKSMGAEGANSYPPGTLEASKQLAHLYEFKKNNDSVAKYLKLTIALNDSLFSKQKTRETQSFAFNEKLHQQELISQQQEDRNRINMFALTSVIIIFLLIGFFLWRNNQHKQKANILLQQQKQKVESTLSELKLTQSQLIQSEKMASLGELTAGIAHEIQNPLNFVNNFSEVNTELIDELTEEVKKGNLDEIQAIAKDIKDNEQKINHHGKRADSIVKGMLQHSQSSNGVKEPTDINKLADEYLRLSYHGLRGKDKSFNVTLQTDFDETIGKINIIPQDIGRVLLNLFNNAFYTVAEKKRQVGETLPTGQAGYEPTVLVSTKKISDKVSISVRDNGNGIPQKIADKIFQPFFTTKPTGQGTGLGLSLSYDIIKAHGGEIKVATKEGEGADFIILLPIYKTEAT